MPFKEVQYFVIAAAAVALGVLGCAKGNSSTSRVEPHSAAAQPTAVADNYSDNPTFSDAQILALLDEANVADSIAAAFAMTKATNEDVKHFARDMMDDHHELRRDGQEVATKLNLVPQAPQMDPVRRAARREMDTLQAAPAGSQFNRAYMEQEIAMHQQVIQLTTDLRAQAQAPEVKDFIDKAHSVLLKHLGNAQTVEQKLTTTP